MNKYYSYPEIDYWQADKWTHKRCASDAIFQYIQANDVIRETDYVPMCDDPLNHPLYRKKIHGIDDPAVVKFWADQGLDYMSTEQGRKCWIALAPTEAITGGRPTDLAKLPFLIVPHREKADDPWWAMKTMAANKAYNEMLARERNFILIYLPTDGPDTDRIDFSIIQEATTLYPCDINRLYLDVSKVVGKGEKLSDIPEIAWKDAAGVPCDPDGAVEYFGDLAVPVLNVSGRWGSGDSTTRNMVVENAMNVGHFDPQWLIHSDVGRRFGENLLFDNRFNHVDDPEVIEYFARMGLRLEIKHSNGVRWLLATPECAFEEPEKKLPLVLIMQEVYEGNEQLSINGLGSYHQMCRIAAQGECILLFFALEDPDSNDIFRDLAEDAIAEYPIDRSRIYIMGHSHDGYFSYAFTCRNQDFVTAYASLGMDCVPFAMNEEHDHSKGSPLEGCDMPCITVTGMYEAGMPQDEAKWLRWIAAWKRNLRVLGCPVPSDEAFRETAGSPNRAIRTLCLPADHAETIFVDGVEHYIGDFNNTAGKCHFRVIRSQNMPHVVTQHMQEFAWSWLRQFRRDPETKVVEEI